MIDRTYEARLRKILADAQAREDAMLPVLRHFAENVKAVNPAVNMTVQLHDLGGYEVVLSPREGTARATVLVLEPHENAAMALGCVFKVKDVEGLQHLLLNIAKADSFRRALTFFGQHPAVTSKDPT